MPDVASAPSFDDEIPAFIEPADDEIPASLEPVGEADEIPVTESPDQTVVSLLSQGKTYSERARIAANSFDNPTLRPYFVKALAAEQKAKDSRSASEKAAAGMGAAIRFIPAVNDAIGRIVTETVPAVIGNIYNISGEGHPLESTPERARAYGEAMAAIQTAVTGYHGIVRKTKENLSDAFTFDKNKVGTVLSREELLKQATGQNPAVVNTQDEYETRAEADVVEAMTLAEAAKGALLPAHVRKQLEAKGALIRPDVVGALSEAYDPQNVLEFGLGAAVGKSAAKAAGKEVVATGLLKAAPVTEPGFAARAVSSVFGAAGEKLVKASDNPVIVGTLAGSAVALSGGDPTTVVLAAVLGAGSTRKSGMVSSALEKSGGALVRVGDQFAGRASLGPMGRFAEGALAFSKPALRGGGAGLVASAPFALGSRDEDDVLNTVAGGVAFGLGGGLVGSTYAKAADKFAIHNVFKSKADAKPDSAYERPEYTPYSPDSGHPLEVESKRVFDTLSNRGAQTVEVLKKLFSKPGEDGMKTEIYLGGQAAADAFAKSMGLDSTRAGVTIELPKEGRRVVFINADSNGGISLGHEVGHGFIESLPAAEKKQMVDTGLELLFKNGQFFTLRDRYAEKFNTVRDAAGNLVQKPKDQWVYRDDEYYVKEYLAENFSAYLNGIPIEKFGTPRSLADRIRISIGSRLEKAGARKLTADGSAAVQTPLGYKPSAALAEMFDNFMQARKLENTTLPGETPPEVGVPPVLEKPEAKPATPAPAESVPAVTPEPAAVTPAPEATPTVAPEVKVDQAEINRRASLLRKAREQLALANELGANADVIAKAQERVAAQEAFFDAAFPAETPAPASTPAPATPKTTPTAEDLVAPKQVENVVRPEAPAPTPGAKSLRPKAADAFVEKATDEVHLQNRKDFEGLMSAPRGQIPVVEVTTRGAASPVESPDAVVRAAQRKAADALEKSGQPNPFRQAFQKLFVPYRWATYKLSEAVNARLYGKDAPRQPGGVYGMSVDKVGQNLDLLRGIALENPKIAETLARSGFDAAYLSSPEIVSDFRKYLENQANGFGGGGERLVRPADTRPGSITPEATGFVPNKLSPEKRQLFNLLLNFEQQSSRTAGMEFSARFAKQNGIDPLTVGFDDKGRPLTENNALRASLIKQGFDPRILNSAVENLPTENFTSPLKVRPDIKFPAADVAIAQAGFMPETSSPRRPQGNDETRSVAAQYAEKAGIKAKQHDVYAPTDEATLKRIADFYEQAKHEPNRPEVEKAYRALAEETRAQYDEMVANGIEIEPYEGKGEPYANSAAMLADVRDNKHLYFFLTKNAFGEGENAAGNALLEKSGIRINGHDLLYNDLFRAVHDYFGHTAEGFEFGPRGEYNAYLAHSRMFSDAAKPALAAETLAQNAWVNFGPQLRRTDGSLPKPGDVDFVPIAKRRFADQKNTVVPEELLRAADPQASFMPESPNTPEFKKWFGDSKVVDESGAPKIVYHGTDADFSRFKRRIGDIGMHFGTPDQANDRIAYTRGRDGGDPTGLAVMPVYLSLKNPLRLPDVGAWNAENLKSYLLDLFPADSRRIGSRWGSDGLKSTASIREFLQSKGYDGVVYRNTGEVGGSEPFREAIASAKTEVDAAFGKGKSSFTVEDQKNPAYRKWSDAMDAYAKHREANAEDSYIAFEPTQIKSATGNRGTFDPTNPDIRYMPEQLDAPEKLPHAIRNKTLTLVHKGTAGLSEIDPAKFGSSKITPRSELSGEPRSYYYVKGFENKSDPVMGRGTAYEIPVSGKRIYNGDTDPLDWSQEINRQKADLMLKDAGYAGVIRTRGEGKNKFKQVELFEKVSTNGEPVSETDVRTPRSRLETPEGREVAARLREKYGSTGAYFDRLNKYKETGEISFMPEASVQDFAPEKIKDALTKRGWAIFTAENPDGKPASPAENAKLLAGLKADLDEQGLVYEPVLGKYGSEENSLLVFDPGMSIDKARELANEYQQDAVLVPEGFVYRDGSVLPASGIETFDTPPEDYYSKIGDSYFSVKFAREFGDPLRPDSKEVQQMRRAAKVEPLPNEELTHGIDKEDAPVESLLDLEGQKISWMPETDPAAYPTLDAGILEQIKKETPTIAAIHIDRMRVGSYKGIDLQGGMFYPAIKENLEKGVVWAFNSPGVARTVARRAAKNNGYVKLVLMSEGNVIGNKTFASIWFNDLRESIAKGDLKEKRALQELNRVRRLFASETGHKTKWETLDAAQQEITDMPQMKRGATYFQKSRVVTKSEGEKIAYQSLLAKKMTELGFPDTPKIVSEIEEPAFKGVPSGAAVGVLRFDPVSDSAEIKTAAEAGVPEHKSYKYVLTGKPVAKLENYSVVDVAYPETKNQIMTQQHTDFPVDRSISSDTPQGRIRYSLANEALPARTAPQAPLASESTPTRRAPLSDVRL